MAESRGAPRVRNKAAAPQQISAEQLLREAVDRQEEKVQAPTQRFADLEELHEYQGRKRKEFEDYVRRNRISMKNWMQYAQWELEQKEYRRARSVFERALDVDSTSIVLWIRYIEAEMKERNINHARNLLDRAVTILPRNDKLWYKYVHMEETLGNVAGTRQVFERWMSWQPDQNAWSAYIKLEKRYGEYDRARDIFKRFTFVHPEPPNWIKWARFEEENGTSELVRAVFSEAIETLGEDFMDEKIFMSFARFETKSKEYDRARAIYKLALDSMPRSQSGNLHAAYTRFEKQFGGREGVEDVILSKRRVQYEETLRESPKQYDTWIEYGRLEESGGDFERTCDVYERAIAEVPPSTEKRHWRRYVYLFIFYALYCETSPQKDISRAKAVYQKALEIVPHKHFTFAKLWVLYAQFLVRQGELTQARKTLGRALGLCPKDRIFRSYLELERKLFEFTRCRTLHTKRLEFDPSNCAAWIEFAHLERALDDVDRAKAIFELGVSQEVLDMPERLWRAYINFMEDEGEYDDTRKLYERLLQKTSHVKVWVSYATFELSVPDPDTNTEEEDEATGPTTQAIARARKIFTRAGTSFKASDDAETHEQRAQLLEKWLAFERECGDAESLAEVEKKQPRKAKKRRKVGEGEWEEYVAWIFPEDQETNGALVGLMERARLWKKQQEEGALNGNGNGNGAEVG
ncbi:MAG: hypothetical protein Q9162_003706 [Coniocarpon cinnabarinum]